MEECCLVAGHRYKVRLKPKEELLDVVEEHRFQYSWFKDYMDGQVGVLHCDGGKPVRSVHKVFWEDGIFWDYRLEQLKRLGEL